MRAPAAGRGSDASMVGAAASRLDIEVRTLLYDDPKDPLRSLAPAFQRCTT